MRWVPEVKVVMKLFWCAFLGMSRQEYHLHKDDLLKQGYKNYHAVIPFLELERRRRRRGTHLKERKKKKKKEKKKKPENLTPSFP